MINIIEGDTANIVWGNVARKIQDRENTIEQPSRAGPTRELLHVLFTIKNPRQRWVTVRNPGVNPAFAIAEVIWIMNGRQDSNFLLPWNHQLSQYAGSASNYHGAYGYRLRKNLDIDQLDRAYQALHQKPESRQVVLQIWDSKKDFPNLDGTPRDIDIPCNLVSLLKVRNGKLEWMQILRSNDLFRGTPYNFIQFTSMQEIMAGWLGLEVGEYHQLSDSLHVYENDLIHVDALSINDEPNLDSLCLLKDESDQVIKDMGQRIEKMGSENLSEEGIKKLIENADIPHAYRNLLLIVASEAARRRGWNDLVHGFMSGCTNPTLIQAWFGWVSRFKN